MRRHLLKAAVERREASAFRKTRARFAKRDISVRLAALRFPVFAPSALRRALPAIAQSATAGPNHTPGVFAPRARCRAPCIPPCAIRIDMIRPILQELAIFLAPFAVYVVYLWATRAKVLDPQSWPLSRLMWLTIVALLSVVLSFIVLAHWGGEPAGSQYVPAHMENGRLVPGKSAK
jgi:hypothetical protein